MEPLSLIAALTEPGAYPEQPERVEVRQTHISIVFLAGSRVYKVKKPLRLAFLDYSTLDRRRDACEAEVLLNRRLAPGVYLGVVPIVREGDGLKVGGTGEVVEWAVEMVRLPDEATLRALLASGHVDPGLIAELGRRIAVFHAGAERNEQVADLSRRENLERTIRQNLVESAREVGATVSESVYERLGQLTEQWLESLGPCLADRWHRGLPCDSHGDLRPEHVYFLPDRRPPGDITIVDAIEFNEAFRATDPAADTAFLAMELIVLGRPDLARGLVDAYVSASGDHELRRLLPLFISYRAAVRAKVGGLKAAAVEVPEAERARARDRARGYWLAALSALEEPGRRPGLVLVGGLPGTGKSTLAARLAGLGSFEVVRTDEVRKERAGTCPADAAADSPEVVLYSPESTDRVYRRCLERAEAMLLEGRRVIVDATFRTEAWRRAFLGLAARLALPSVFLVCGAEERIVRGRLAARRDDVSDADEEVYRRFAREWEPISELSRRSMLCIDTGGDLDGAVARACDGLRGAELLDGSPTSTRDGC